MLALIGNFWLCFTLNWVQAARTIVLVSMGRCPFSRPIVTKTKGYRMLREHSYDQYYMKMSFVVCGQDVEELCMGRSIAVLRERALQ